MKWIWTIALALAVTSCGKEPSEEPVAAPVPAAAPPPPAPAPAPAAEAADDDVAVAEDFIDEATAEVTAANYKAKLTEIEQEMAAEPE